MCADRWRIANHWLSELGWLWIAVIAQWGKLGWAGVCCCCFRLSVCVWFCRCFNRGADLRYCCGSYVHHFSWGEVYKSISNNPDVSILRVTRSLLGAGGSAVGQGWKWVAIIKLAIEGKLCKLDTPKIWSRRSCTWAFEWMDGAWARFMASIKIRVEWTEMVGHEPWVTGQLLYLYNKNTQQYLLCCITVESVIKKNANYVNLISLGMDLIRRDQCLQSVLALD